MPNPPEFEQSPAGAIARQEAANVLRQFDYLVSTVQAVLEGNAQFQLSVPLLQELNRIALEGLDPHAGELRTGRVFITNSEHQPPPASQVAELLAEMSGYVNDAVSESATHLAAYVMWRLNWIHPFADGNGRTSRAASYLVLCIKLGYLLPGSNTIPSQIARNRRRYLEVLEDCDAAWRGGRLDVRPMERLIERYLVRQLESADGQDSGDRP